MRASHPLVHGRQRETLHGWAAPRPTVSIMSERLGSSLGGTNKQNVCGLGKSIVPRMRNGPTERRMGDGNDAGVVSCKQRWAGTIERKIAPVCYLFTTFCGLPTQTNAHRYCCRLAIYYVRFITSLTVGEDWLSLQKWAIVLTGRARVPDVEGVPDLIAALL